MKKSLCILLIIALSLSTLQTPSYAQTPEDLVAPCAAYNAEVDLIIDDDGLATVSITYLGDRSITYVRVVTYLQVIERGLWARVDIPATDDQWVVSTNGTSLSNTHTVQLPEMGHYRAFCQFTFTFSDGTVKDVYRTCEEIY